MAEPVERATITKIAEQAGVSIATVSRVLNNSRRVTPELVERVQQAMQAMNLPALPERRRPRTRASSTRNATIALVAIGQGYQDWFGVPVIASIVAELTRAAQDQGLGVLMADMPDPQRLNPLLRRSEVKGAIVFIGGGRTPRDAMLLTERVPVVRVMGGQWSASPIDHITSDNNAIGFLAATRLLEQDHRQLAFLTVQPTWEISRLRALGFLAATVEAGIEASFYVGGEIERARPFFGPAPVLRPTLPELIAELKSRHTGKLGLFITRDEETVDVYRELRNVGLEPGRDVTILSCDNEAVRLSMLHPRPPSIDLNPAELAQRAIRRLMFRMKHPQDPPIRILVSPVLPGPNGELPPRR
jgi:DNA-binding LacI/PurR family transcriptional regulator